MNTLQHFELHVLLALEKRLERPVAQAAVFIALRRLERKGLVTSRMDERDGARARRYFKITKQGTVAVREQRAEHARLWRGLGRLLQRG
jgi:DNA-binding PadR family transcriptional regulator